MSLLVAGAAAVVFILMICPLRPRRRRLEPLVGATDSPRAARFGSVLVAWQQRRGARRAPSARAVAEWCDELARSVRSGSTLRDSLMVVATGDPAIDRALAPVRLAIDRGASIGEAVDRVDDPGRHLQLAVSVVATAGRLGGPSSAAIDRTAMALRRRAAEVDDRSAQAAQARLSTHVLTAVPLLMLAVLVTTDAEVRAVVASPVGAMCVGAGLVLSGVGWWWMGRIVGTAQRA